MIIIEEKEILTVTQRYNEYVMTSIRTSWGCDEEHISNIFGSKYLNYFQENVVLFVKEGKVIKNKTRYFLTEKGKLFADAIASDLFFQ